MKAYNTSLDEMINILFQTNLEFEGTGYANYPKVSVTDWNDLFDDYLGH